MSTKFINSEIDRSGRRVELFFTALLCLVLDIPIGGSGKVHVFREFVDHGTRVIKVEVTQDLEGVISL